MRVPVRSKRLAVSLVVLSLLSPVAVADTSETRRLEKAAEALQRIMESPDYEIPEKLLDKSRCIAVFPGVVKAALGWGGRHGRGVVSCRAKGGEWSPPSFINISGGSIGFQIGVEKTDLVLCIMTETGARSLVQTEFTLGAQGAVAAGPLGRSVEGSTDIKLDAEIYSYAISKGLFAGVSLEGARVNEARKANRRFYGSKVDPDSILFGHKAPNVPAAAREFMSALP